MANKYDGNYFQHHSIALAQEKHWLSNALNQGLLTVSEAKIAAQDLQLRARSLTKETERAHSIVRIAS
jgi:hypothetical protein